jgi:NADPH:quinone reductase-like Zn-dependent oxidoreductase
MKAAVVRHFDQAPRYEDVATSVATAGRELVDVVAVGLHPRVRSQSNGTHYTSTGQLPLIPGIDGVGRRADGSLVYFVLSDTTLGSMAEQAVIDPARSIPLPGGADVAAVAAAMNPGMSSWVALRTRVAFLPGQSVLVLGATGSAGRLAIQIAKRLGAGRVIAVGRGADKLAVLRGLGADVTIDLAAETTAVVAELGAHAAQVDVVLDYLWGPPAEAVIFPILAAREDASALLSWIQIGAVAGSDIRLPSAALRQANIHFFGSGQGSVSARGILENLPSLAAEVLAGSLSINAVAHPLAEVESVWTESARGSTERTVLIP